jgi:hypothetical protein
VFPDLFLPNLLVFALGQAAAIVYMRSGLVRPGVVLLLALLLTADAALLARFAYGHRDAWFFLPLAAMQALALLGAGWLLFAGARRRWSRTSRQKSTLFDQAFVAYLKNDLPAAARQLTVLRRADPWDPVVAIGLANVLRLQGKQRQAKGLYRRARSLDRRGEYSDLVTILAARGQHVDRR